MPQILEAGMVILFGISWPLNIAKSYRSRTAKGKSLWFLCFVFVGYICGIAGKFAGRDITYVLAFYIINLVMVGIDIALYFRNRRLDASASRAFAD